MQLAFDYSGIEYDKTYLEGTGAIVLDYIERMNYAANSKRTDSCVLELFFSHFTFESWFLMRKIKPVFC